MATQVGIDRGGYGPIRPRANIELIEQSIELIFNTGDGWNPNAAFFIGDTIDTTVMADGQEANDVAVLDEFKWSFNVVPDTFGNRYSSSIYDAAVNVGLKHPDEPQPGTYFELQTDKQVIGYDSTSEFRRGSSTYPVTEWAVDVSPELGTGTHIEAEPDLGLVFSVQLGSKQRTVPLHQKIWPFSELQFIAGVDFYGSAVSEPPGIEETVYILQLRLELTWHYEKIRA